VSTEPLTIDEATELHGRIVGLSLAAGGDIVVRVRPDDSRTIVEAVSSEALGKSAARRFGQTVRALVDYEHVGAKSSATLERLEDWEPDDFLNVMRSVRDDLAARGVVVDAAEWLEELN
jgi:hypothetical protein